MNSQEVVLRWFECTAASTLLLIAIWWGVSRLLQPVDRVNLILLGLLASALLPIALSFAPGPRVHLGLFVAGWPDTSPVEASTQLRNHRPQLPNQATSVPQLIRPNEQASVNAAPLQSVVESSPRTITLPHADSRHTPKVDTSAPVIPIQPIQSVEAEGRLTIPAASWWAGSGWLIAASILAVVHGVAVLYFMFEWIVGSIYLSRICRRAHPANDAVWETWHSIRGTDSRAVRLFVSTEVQTPLVFGWWRPAVLLPQALAEGNRSSLRFCLAHEWAHVFAGDLWAWRLTNLCRYVLWYQPLYWGLRRELRVCQDLIADDRAVGARGASDNHLQYSELLMSMAKQQLQPTIPSAIGFHDRSSQLTRRVTILLTSDQTIHGESRKSFLLMIGGLVLVIAVSLSALRLNASEDSNDLAKMLPRHTGSKLPQDLAEPKSVQDVADGVRLLGDANRLGHLAWTGFAISPNGKQMVVVINRDLVFIDLETNSTTKSIPIEIGQRVPWVLGLQHSPSGKFLVIWLLIADKDSTLARGYNFSDNLIDEWKIPSGNYLVVFEDGRMIGQPILVEETARFLHPAPQLLVSPNERWLIWQHEGTLKPFDLEQNRALPNRESFPVSFFDSDDEVVNWNARQSLNLATGKISDWSPPTEIAGATFNSVSLDGKSIVVSGETDGVAVYHLDSKKTTRFAGLISTTRDRSDSSETRYQGQLSPNGTYFAGFGKNADSDAELFFVYDLNQQKFVIEPIAGIGSFFFQGNLPSIIVLPHPEYVPHQIELGPNSKASLDAALDSFAGSNLIRFSDQNRQLVIGKSQRWIDVETGKTRYRRDRTDGFVDLLVSPFDTSAYGFEAAAVASYSVQQRDTKNGQIKTLYSHHSTSHVNSVMNRLLGRDAETTGVVGLELKLDKTGQFLYEVRHESHLGFIFRQWNLAGKKVDWETSFRVRTPIVDMAGRVANISADGSRYAVTTDSHLWVIDSKEGTLVREFDLPRIPQGLKLDRHGKRIAIEYCTGYSVIDKLVILDTQTGKELRTWSDGPFLSPVFSTTGDMLALMRPGKTNRLTVYNTKTWDTIWTYETSHSPATALDISPDFQKLALSLSDTRIETWDLKKLGLLAE